MGLSHESPIIFPGQQCAYAGMDEEGVMPRWMECGE